MLDVWQALGLDPNDFHDWIAEPNCGSGGIHPEYIIENCPRCGTNDGSYPTTRTADRAVRTAE